VWLAGLPRAWYPRIALSYARESYDPADSPPSAITLVAPGPPATRRARNYRDLTKHLAPRPALLDPQRRPSSASTAVSVTPRFITVGTVISMGIHENDRALRSELGATCLPNTKHRKFMQTAGPSGSLPTNGFSAFCKSRSHAVRG